jgi:hypothetical protein
MLIHLTPKLIDLSYALARRRLHVDRAAGVGGFINTTRMSDVEFESMSIRGEMAFSRLFNVECDLSQDLQRCGMVDNQLGHLRVEIKTTNYCTGRLQVKIKGVGQQSYAHYYCLMVEVAVGILRYAGYAASSEIIGRRVYEFAGRPSAYGLRQDQLHQGSEPWA